MLSRVKDARVFESSDDVILPSSSRQYLHLGAPHHRLYQPSTNEHMEDEQLHPHHPYRLQKHVLQRKRERKQQKDTRNGMAFDHPVNYPPMELVFLSSGEILAREDCPPGLQMPELELDASMNKYLEYHGEESESEEERQYIDSLNRFKRPMEGVTQQERPGVARQPFEKSASSSSTSSRSKSLILENVATGSNNDTNAAVSNVVRETGEKEQAATQRQSKRAATRGNASPGTGHERIQSRNEVERMAASPLALDNFSLEPVNEQSSRSCGEAPSASNGSDSNQKDTTSSSEGTAQEIKRRPRSLHQRLRMAKVEHSKDLPARRSKRSPKMEVGHLESEPLTLSEEDQALSKDKDQFNELAFELQREKERVLDKMTRLLDEQGKNQQLQARIEALEEQLAAKDGKPSNAIPERTHEKEVQKQLHEEAQGDCTSALEDPSRQDEDQRKVASKPLEKVTMDANADQGVVGRDTDEVKTERHAMEQLLRKFIASIKRWKDSTTEEMQRCDDHADMLALFERQWLNFPQFPNMLAKGFKTSLVSDVRPDSTPGDEELADAMFVLKKRLRQREDELRQIHGNYVDLKEMCARQCVRESVLQKFINEHRLRGNLIIRKHSETISNATGKNQEALLDDHEESANYPKISRGTNTSARYHDDDDYVMNEEDVHYQEDDDDDESTKDEYSVRTPQVFVQVGRNGVYERAIGTESAVAQKLASESRGKQSTHSKPPRAERVRLIPSSSLSQRYERVPTPTATPARRKKPLDQHKVPRSSAASRMYPELVGQCPPGCGSRASSMRRKTPRAGRPKVSQRPTSATSTRGAIGVVRPWM